MMTYKYNYTVIIPHKNVPKLLVRGVESIPQRDDIQIIVVDDNSDNINENDLINSLRKDVEIICTKEGRGAGYARNIGLEKAKGKWILFLDADDYFLPNAFENAVDKYIETDADIVYFGATSVYSDTGKKAERHLGIMRQLCRYKKEKKDSEDKLKYGFVNPVCKLIRHSMIRKYHIKFDEIMFSNDVMFSVMSAYYAKKICVDDSPIYCISVVEGSLVNRVSIESIKCRFVVNLRKNKFLRSINQHENQVSIMNHLFFAFKKGPFIFIQFLKLAIEYRANPFIGYRRWLKTILEILKSRKEKSKYQVLE